MKKFYPVLQFVLLFSVGVTLLWLVFRNEDTSAIWSKIVSADYRWVGLSLFISIGSYWIRAVRWKMLIEPLGYNPKLSNTFYAMMVGYLANLALPRLGEVSRCAALNRAEKIPIEKLVGTVIVERLIDVICLLGCMVVAAFVEYDLLHSFLSKYLVSPVKDKFNHLADSYVFIASGIVLIALFIFVLYKWRQKILQHTFAQKIRSLGKGLAEGLRSVMHMKNNVLYIFLSVLMWSFYMLTSYLCFFSLEATKNLDLSAGLFVLVAGGAGMSAPVQGGIGAYHFFVSEILSLFNIPVSDGKVFATVVHGSQTIFAIVLGFLSLLLLYFSRRKTAREALVQ